MSKRPGWVPKGAAKRGGPTPKSLMTNDPNADLLGYTLPTDSGVGTVTGTARWNPQYVTVSTPRGETCRVAAQVRRRRELNND